MATSTYDLVDRKHFLYARIIKARDLPAKEITSGSCDPYIEVKLGNYRKTTKRFEKNSNPEWNQVFAFSKERLQSSLEVVVKDKSFTKDDFIGRVIFDLNKVPTRVAPDSPLVPQWYRLEDKNGESKVKGELMLSVWMGTQADEAFPEAWHSYAATEHSDVLAKIMSVLSELVSIGQWFDDIRNWKNPIATVLVHILFLILVRYPNLILTSIFLCMFLTGIWHYRFRPQNPPHIVSPDEVDEGFDTFPGCMKAEIVRMRHERLRIVAGRIQTVFGDLVTQGLRLQSLLSWIDPHATTIFITYCLLASVLTYVIPFQVVAVLVGVYLLRHPRFRNKLSF
ncbi:hypothetical protein SUGI_1196640 [Cryptomeria japonica]|uniref:FT-interacting protein 3-like n=1 Tax=Cryptomeria japonica TaxID=3369 RepID=UPI002414CADA|nr:FT-interacting protein 3-like [Cryptomeria japonica]GLJ55707.1 hypothetical protein SUGI_1196640 [Cryptomeria japonica]